MAVTRLNQVVLPSPAPALQLLFSNDGGLSRGVDFEIHQPPNPIPPRISSAMPFLMLPYATRQIIGYADINCAARHIGEDVDIKLLFHPAGRLGAFSSSPTQGSRLALRLAGMTFEILSSSIPCFRQSGRKDLARKVVSFSMGPFALP